MGFVLLWADEQRLTFSFSIWLLCKGWAEVILLPHHRKAVSVVRHLIRHILKIITRLLLTLPFMVVTLLYLKLNLSDNGCWGLIELIYSIGLWIFLVITFILSVFATLRKRQSEKLKAEPYSLSLTLFSLLILFVGGLWGDNLKGAKWIEAKSQNYNAQPSAQDLTLRKNGTFTVYLREDDFTCYYSGNYRKFADTLRFDNSIIGQTNSKMTVQYLLKNKTILPLTNENEGQDNFAKFDIVSIR